MNQSEMQTTLNAAYKEVNKVLPRMATFRILINETFWKIISKIMKMGHLCFVSLRLVSIKKTLIKR